MQISVIWAAPSGSGFSEKAFEVYHKEASCVDLMLFSVCHKHQQQEAPLGIKLFLKIARHIFHVDFPLQIARVICLRPSNGIRLRIKEI